jgi:hypothetical protein
MGVAPFGGYPQPMAQQYPNNNQFLLQQQQQSQAHHHQQAQQQSQAPPQQPQTPTKLHVSHSSPSLSSQASSTVSPTKSAAPPSSPTPKDSSSSSESATSGVVHKVRKGLFKWLYPDAHDTTENMGNKLEAYFDKATGKWVFPGEVIIPLCSFLSM